MVARNLNWNDIRPINNSLNEGFEELVCQLAKLEKEINDLYPISQRIKIDSRIDE